MPSCRAPCRINAAGAVEALGSTWSFLDITPYGRRQEDWPQTPPYTWAGWHDKYEHTLAGYLRASST